MMKINSFTEGGERLLLPFVVLAFGVVFYIQNTIVPFFSDDLYISKDTYPFDDFLSKLNFLLDFAWDFWNSENGRISNQLLWKILTLSGEDVFDVFNGVLFVVIVFMIVKIATDYKTTLSPLPFVIVLFYELYLIPNSESLYFWAGGSLNYLFPAALATGFMLLLRWLNTKEKVPFVIIVVLCVYSFVSGFSHEIYSLPISFSLFVALFHRRFRVNKLLIVPLLFYWVGALLVVVSPGTIHRILSTQGGGGSIPLATVLMSRFLQAFKIFHYGRLFYVVLGVVIVLAVCKRKSFFCFIKRYYFLLLCMFSSLFIVSVLGVGGRAVCGVEFFALLIIVNYTASFTSGENKNIFILSFVFLALMLVHQIFLIPYMNKSWDTYKKVAAQTALYGGKIQTIEMEDWHSNNCLVEPFVAHPYKMMREDIWMRMPLNCEVCRDDVFNTLSHHNEGEKLGEIGDDYILEFSGRLKKCIDDGRIYMALEPVSEHIDGGLLYVYWHMLLQSVFPSRYPTEIKVSRENVVLLNVGGRQYCRFESLYVPIPRKVLNVYFK